MLETIAKQLGPGFIVPVILILLGGWLARVLLDVHTSSRQSRRDFLDVWRTVDHDDDLALETAVRHVWGTYLPAPVIRAAVRSPYPSDLLRRLIRSWDHPRFDADAGRVVIASRWLSTPLRRRAAALTFLLAYVGLASTGMLLLQDVAHTSPSELLTWLRVILAVVLFLGAIACLGRSDSVSALNRDGAQLAQTLTARLGAIVAPRAQAPPAPSPAVGAGHAA